jgi:hypothetical protein
MSDQQLQQIHQQLFFQLNVGKIDLYHFEKIREIVVVKEGMECKPENAIKVFKY